MTKREFLEAIRKGISTLSTDDINKSIRYYSEMIDDRIEDGVSEEEAVAAMGNPDDVIAEILSETPSVPTVAEQATEQADEKEENSKKGFKYGWIVAVAIAFAAIVTSSAVFMPFIKAGFNADRIIAGWGNFNIGAENGEGVRFNSISITESFSDIKIERSDTNECFVRFSNIEGIHRFYNIGDDGVLYITYADDRNWFQKMGGIWYADSSLTLYLTRDMYDKLHIETGSADVSVTDNLYFENVEISTASGDIDFRSDTSSTPAELKSASGDISISHIERGGFAIETSSGDVIVKKVYTCAYKEITGSADELIGLEERFGLGNDILIKTSSGDIEIDGARAVNMLLETTSGEIKLADVYNYVNLQAEAVSGDINAQNVVSCIGISFKTTSGDIDFEGIDSYMQMNLASTSGDIDGYINSKRYFSVQTSSGSVSLPEDDGSAESNGKPVRHCSVTTVSGDISIRMPE